MMSDGSVFVADGYCNGRIVHFDSFGHVIRAWGSVGGSKYLISIVNM